MQKLSRLLIILAFILGGLSVSAQNDSIPVDSIPALPPLSFHLQTFGLSWVDGSMQFFEGYGHQILYANAQSGLPIYPDWQAYSRGIVIPSYYQFGSYIAFVDSIRGYKLRLGVHYSHRSDSMAYGSDFAINDTVFGRRASEKGAFGTVSFGGMKQTRKILNFLRFHGGAEFEIGMSPKSKIAFAEYSYDIGDKKIIEYNEFRAKGNPRFLVFGSAILGLETTFLNSFGFTAEVKSGLGAQLVVKEKGFGMARTSYHFGLNYYLFEYKRKPLPRYIPIQMEDNDNPSPPPTPNF